MSISLTLIIVVVTCLVSWQAFNNKILQYNLMHYPFAEQREKQYYRWVTSMFVHGDTTHLFFNMFSLYSFGEAIEGAFVNMFGEILGRINFVALYFLSGIFADVPTFLKHKDNPNFSSVGASGATSGIVFAFILLSPWSQLGLFFIIPIRAVLFGVLYLVYCSYAAKNDIHKKLDHMAHFWGAVFGFAFTIALKPELFGRFINAVIDGFPF